MVYKYVATRTDPLVNIPVDIMYELPCIRATGSFRFHMSI